jgi:predicted ATPase/DNA-binding CsgD family transcriptional regulator
MQHESVVPPARQTGGSEQASHPSLPLSLTSLIGREREAAEVCSLLRRPAVRLLTLVGTGGVGKTRLGFAVAEALQEDFADGVCFVPLAPVSDSTRVLPAIAQALSLWKADASSVEEQVRATLRDRHLLLLLDNFEHVVQAAPQLTSLLASCPLLSILVTSRAALRLSGEHEFLVLPLAVPDLRQVPELQILAQMAAVRLFVQRAQAIQHTFRLTPANAQTIAAICARLDGLPLALELAAARIKLLPPRALLQRLSRRLDVLTRGASDLPDRQQTLRNTLQWSYDLLGAEEQRLFRWLSIFVGGCTLEAVEAICQLGGDQVSSVLDTLTSLLDKSLVQQIEQEGEEPRFIMLETIREFGLEHLLQQGEREAARRAYAHYYLELAEQARQHLLGPKQLLWLDRLEREIDNLRIILLEATKGEGEEVELALRLGSALWRFWIGRRYLREGRALLNQLLASPQAVAAPIRLKALITLGALIATQNDMGHLEPVADEALALAEEQEDQWNKTFATVLRGIAILVDKSKHEEAQARLEKALSEARVLGDRWLLIQTLAALGSLALYHQDYPRAVLLLEESIAQCRVLGEGLGLSAVLFVLAHTRLHQGDIMHTRALLEEALVISRAMGHTLEIAKILSLLGQVALQQGELSQAQTFLADSARIASEVGDQWNAAQTSFLLAELAERQENWAVAHVQYEEALTIALDIKHSDFTSFGLKGLGCLAAVQGQALWAARLWGAAEPLQSSSSVISPPALYEKMLVQVHDQVGEFAFAQALSEGQAMTPAKALASYQNRTAQSAQLSISASPPTSTRSPSPYPAGLTPREVEVLRLVALGFTDAQVAEQLIISHRTVTTHLTSIYNKLGVNSRVGATRFAVEHYLL